MCKLYISMLDEIVAKKMYQAKLLNSINFSFENGILITLHSYSDIMMILWSSILDIMTNLNKCAKIFDTVLKNEKRKYCTRSKQLNEQFVDQIHGFYFKNKKSDKESLDYLENIKYTDFCTFEEQLYKNCYYIGLIQGNAQMDQCEEIKEYLHKFLCKKMLNWLNLNFQIF